nr:tetratricopeptide repeat protein [Streptomyces violens]
MKWRRVRRKSPSPAGEHGTVSSVRVTDSGDAIAWAPHSVAISGHISQLSFVPPAPRTPVEWPVRLGGVPTLASAFQDRASARERIDQARADHTTVVLAQVLSGGGGVGKTQLAAAYAHQALVDGVELVIWVDASETEQVIAHYARAARHVQTPGVDEPDERDGGPGSRSAEDAARLFLQWLATTSRSWLVVLDDITDPDAMQPWWPPPSASGRGRVLATTRRQDALLSGGGRAVVAIGTYSAAEADAYLRERLAAAHAAHLLDGKAAELADVLGHLPLALSHAAAYMVNEDVTCAEYLRRFTDSAARLDDLLPRHADTEGYGRQVATALLLSLDVAQVCEPVGLAVPALRLASVLDPAGHPRSLWSSGAVTHYLNSHRTASSPDIARPDVGPAEAQAALRLLHRYGLIVDDAHADYRAVRLHALTARATREYIPGDVLPRVVRTAVDALTELWEDSYPFDRTEAGVMRANVDNLAACTEDLLWEIDGHHLLRWAGHHLIDYGLATAAVPYWQRLTATSERLLGRTHPKTFSARRDLAVAYFKANRDKDAFAVLREDFAYQDQTLAASQPATPQACDRYSHPYGKTGTKEFIALLEDTLAFRERLLGSDDPTTLACQANLAIAHWQTGEFGKATRLLKRAVTGRERVLGACHPDTVAASDRLQRWRDERRKRWRRHHRSAGIP